MGTQPQDPDTGDGPFPPSTPQYAQPPYGGRPPYGQRQQVDPRQWAAAHAAPAPTEIRTRPATVVAGLAAFAAYLAVSLVSSIYSWTHIDQVLADMETQFGTTASLDPAGRAAVQSMTDSFAVVGVVIGLVMLVGYAVAGWFAWTGHNWARIVLWVIGGFGAFGLWTLFASPNAFLTLTAGIGVVLAVAWVVLLAREPSNAWYRSERHRRERGAYAWVR